MRIAVTGSTGLIGSALVRRLDADGHDVVRLVRSAPRGAGEVRWDPAAGSIDADSLAGIDGAVHLAGEGIGTKRWSPEQQAKILDSRVKGTQLLAETLASLSPCPSVLVSGSGIGYYGLRGDEVLTEASSHGSGFLADVCEQWEAATSPAEQAGIRTVHLRSGIVLSAAGGALGKVLPLFRLGLGGKLSRGDQWWSWITLDDEVSLILHLLTHQVEGAVNACTPNPATNAEVTKAIGTALGRPTILPVPRFALNLVMGSGLTDEVILAGQRAVPEAALASGFTFAHPDLGPALRSVLAK